MIRKKFITDFVFPMVAVILLTPLIINASGGYIVNNTFPQLNIDNVSIDGNTISTTDTNGDLTLSPDGSGDIAITADIDSTGNYDLKRNGTSLVTFGSSQITLQNNLNVGGQVITDSTGTLEIGGSGGTNNERELIDFETTANTIERSTDTGVNNWMFSAGSGTTTITIGEVGSEACIQLRNSDNDGWGRMYFNGGTLVSESGTC